MISSIIFDSPKFSSGIFRSKILFDNTSLEKDLNLKVLKKDDDKLFLEFINSYGESYQFFYDLEKLVIETVHQNSDEWLGGKTDYKKIFRMYQKIIKLPTLLKNNPTVEINSKDVKIYDKNDQVIDISELNENYQVKVNITFDSIIFEKDYYELDYIVNKISIINYCCNTEEYMFNDSLESYDDDTEVNLVNTTKL